MLEHVDAVEVALGHVVHRPVRRQPHHAIDERAFLDALSPAFLELADTAEDTLYVEGAARLLVETGERVTRGQPIAYSGNSGRSTAPHLHYEIRRDGRAIDPAPYLR